MQTSTKLARRRKRILATLKNADAAARRAHGYSFTHVVTVGDVDLPAFISNGQLHVQAPLPHIFKAFAEDLSEFLSDLEVRVSTAGGTTLSLDSDGRPVYGATVGRESMGGGREQR